AGPLSTASDNFLSGVGGPIAAVRLCPVQRLIHGTDKIRGIGTARGDDSSHPEADRKERANRRLHMRNSFRRNQFTAALGYLTRGNGVGFGQNQYEFLTAEAREEIARSSRSTAEHTGHTLQAGIAIDVAVVVVVLFEVVDIEQDQRQR